MAGGAGSGKGFAIKNFIEGEKFKIRDPDEIKKAFLRLAKLKNKYPDLQNINFVNMHRYQAIERAVYQKVKEWRPNVIV